MVGGDPEGFLDFAAELAEGTPRPAIEASPDETAFWLYSSGSTGTPKGVRHVHSSLQGTADSYAAEVLALARRIWFSRRRSSSSRTVLATA